MVGANSCGVYLRHCAARASGGRCGATQKSITMSVTVLFFARARELAGVGSEAWELPSDANGQAQPFTTADLSKAMAIKHPSLAPVLSVCAWAVNEEYADAPMTLTDGDEVALIPPISGG